MAVGRAEFGWWVFACIVLVVAALASPVEEGAAHRRFQIAAFRLLLFGAPFLGGIAAARSAKREVDSWLLLGGIALASFLLFSLVWVNFVLLVLILATLVGIDLIAF